MKNNQLAFVKTVLNSIDSLKDAYKYFDKCFTLAINRIFVESECFNKRADFLKEECGIDDLWDLPVELPILQKNLNKFAEENGLQISFENNKTKNVPYSFYTITIDGCATKVRMASPETAHVASLFVANTKLKEKLGEKHSAFVNCIWQSIQEDCQAKMAEENKTLEPEYAEK